MQQTLIRMLPLFVLGVSLLFAPLQGFAATAAGTVLTASGGSWIERGTSKNPVSVKDAVQKSDVLVTDASGNMQVLFADDTTVSIGPNSSLAVEEFVYQESGTKPAFAATMKHGLARFVTGKIVEQNREGFAVTTPQATVGVRGTTFSVQIANGKTDVIGLKITSGFPVSVTNTKTGAVSVIEKTGMAVTSSPSGNTSYKAPAGQFSSSSSAVRGKATVASSDTTSGAASSPAASETTTVASGRSGVSQQAVMAQGVMPNSATRLFAAPSPVATEMTNGGTLVAGLIDNKANENNNSGNTGGTVTPPTTPGGSTGGTVTPPTTPTTPGGNTGGTGGTVTPPTTPTTPGGNTGNTGGTVTPPITPPTTPGGNTGGTGGTVTPPITPPTTPGGNTGGTGGTVTPPTTPTTPGGNTGGTGGTVTPPITPPTTPGGNTGSGSIGGNAGNGGSTGGSIVPPPGGVTPPAPGGSTGLVAVYRGALKDSGNYQLGEFSFKASLTAGVGLITDSVAKVTQGMNVTAEQGSLPAFIVGGKYILNHKVTASDHKSFHSGINGGSILMNGNSITSTGTSGNWKLTDKWNDTYHNGQFQGTVQP